VTVLTLRELSSLVILCHTDRRQWYCLRRHICDHLDYGFLSLELFRFIVCWSLKMPLSFVPLGQRPTQGRKYVDLLFRTTNAFANWQPTIPLAVGDYGRVNKATGLFIRDGNIYEDDLATTYGLTIESPKIHAKETEVVFMSRHAKSTVTKTNADLVVLLAVVDLPERTWGRPHSHLTRNHQHSQRRSASSPLFPASSPWEMYCYPSLSVPCLCDAAH